MVPIVGSAKRAISRPSVVLPEPVEPTIATCWPAGIVTSTFLSTAESEPSRSRLGYENVTSRMSMRSLPTGKAIGSVGGGGPIGRSSTDSTRRSPATAFCVWSSTSVNSAIGSRNRYVRKMNPTSAPAVRLLDGPIHTPTPTIAEMVNAEKISPEGKRKAPMQRRLDLRSRLDLDRVVHPPLEHLPGAVRPDGGRARHHFGDGAEHVAVGVARGVVGAHQSRLHGP